MKFVSIEETVGKTVAKVYAPPHKAQIAVAFTDGSYCNLLVSFNTRDIDPCFAQEELNLRYEWDEVACLALGIGLDEIAKRRQERQERFDSERLKAEADERANYERLHRKYGGGK